MHDVQSFPRIFCSWLYPFFSITYCFNLSRENYDMPKHAPSWKHMYDMLFLSMISIRKHIFSEIKQFFARMKSKENGVSNDVKINLSIYVTEKKNVFVEFFKNTTNLDKWWCVIISFEIGLKWNMILFFLEQSLQR